MPQKLQTNKSQIFNITDQIKESSERVTRSTESSVQVASGHFPVCRICQINTVSENLISPCNCKGTLAYIHLSCLERWLNQSGRNFCELCSFRYKAVQTLRYGLCESIRLWVCHPRHRSHIRSDFIIGILLSLVTGGLLFICLYGREYFTIQAEKAGIKQNWIKLSMAFFLVILVIGYLLSVYLLLKDHLLSWYTWWTRTVNIQLRIPSKITQIVHPEIL